VRRGFREHGQKPVSGNPTFQALRINLLRFLERRISYDPKMRAIYFPILASMVMLAGCVLAEHSQTCASIVDATRVVVTIESTGAQSSEHVITDPQRIRQLIDFANTRRKVSRPSLYTMPAPRENAVFYNKDEFVASIGAGTKFFFVSCANWKGTRPASDAELREFRQLIGSVE